MSNKVIFTNIFIIQKNVAYFLFKKIHFFLDKCDVGKWSKHCSWSSTTSDLRPTRPHMKPISLLKIKKFKVPNLMVYYARFKRILSSKMILIKTCSLVRLYTLTTSGVSKVILQGGKRGVKIFRVGKRQAIFL